MIEVEPRKLRNQELKEYWSRISESVSIIKRMRGKKHRGETKKQGGVAREDFCCDSRLENEK